VEHLCGDAVNEEACISLNALDCIASKSSNIPFEAEKKGGEASMASLCLSLSIGDATYFGPYYWSSKRKIC